MNGPKGHYRLSPYTQLALHPPAVHRQAASTPPAAPHTPSTVLRLGCFTVRNRLSGLLNWACPKSNCTVLETYGRNYYLQA